MAPETQLIEPVYGELRQIDGASMRVKGTTSKPDYGWRLCASVNVPSGRSSSAPPAADWQSATITLVHFLPSFSLPAIPSASN
jgi:hypothetical protein